MSAPAAFASESEPVKAPYVESGDCWSYRADNMTHQGKPVRDYELCVTLVDRAKGTVLAVATVKDDGREIDTAWSLEWATYASVAGLIAPQGVRLYRFPLTVGDRYSIEFDFRDARLGPNAGRSQYDLAVVGWEDVTVPAGTFRALRIEGRGKAWRYDRPATFVQTTTYWYAPAIGRHVKYVYENPSRRIGEELTSYRLNN